jgi:hypothetical protein
MYGTRDMKVFMNVKPCNSADAFFTNIGNYLTKNMDLDSRKV